MINKLIKDGQVAVLYSPGWGAGWSTWAHDGENLEVMFDPVIADLVVNQPPDYVNKIMNHVAIKYPNLYTGGIDDLTVKWLPVGTQFRITEYDGSESIEINNEDYWIVA